MPDGMRFVNQHRLMLILLSIPPFLSLFGLPFVVLMPAFARDLLKTRPSGLGYLMAGSELGAAVPARTRAHQRND